MREQRWLEDPKFVAKNSLQCRIHYVEICVQIAIRIDDVCKTVGLIQKHENIAAWLSSRMTFFFTPSLQPRVISVGLRSNFSHIRLPLPNSLKVIECIMPRLPLPGLRA